MKKNAKPAALPPATKKGGRPAAAVAPAMAPAACPACGKQPVVMSAGPLSAWVCSTANCLTVGARRDSVNKALAAWNSLKPAGHAVVAPPKRTSGARMPWDESAPPPPPRSKAPAPAAAAKAAQAKGHSAKAASATMASPAARPGGIGAFIRELIQKGHETAAILEQVHAKFPHSKATASDVSWNKGKLRKQGVAV